MKWTQEHTDKLREWYYTREVSEIAGCFGCSIATVYNHIEKLGMNRKKRDWTDGEITTLQRMYPTAQRKELESALGRKFGAIHAKAKSLGIKKDKDFLADAFVVGTTNRNKALYMKNPNLIRLKRAHRMLVNAIPKKKCKHEFKGAKKWSNAETAYLVQHHGQMSFETMAKSLGRTHPSIASKVLKLQRNGILGRLPHRTYTEQGSDGRFTKK